MSESKKDTLVEALKKVTNQDAERVKALFEALDAAADGYTNGEIFEGIYLLLKWSLWQKRHDLETFFVARAFTATAVRSMADGIEGMTPTMEESS